MLVLGVGGREWIGCWGGVGWCHWSYWSGGYRCWLCKDCVPAGGVGVLCEQCKGYARCAWGVRIGGVWCDGAGGTLFWRMCALCDRVLDWFRQLRTEVAEDWMVWSRIVTWRTWTNCCRLRVGMLILCVLRLWVCESIVSCWYV